MRDPGQNAATMTDMPSRTDNDANAIISPRMLLLAYRSGIFPMAESRDDPDVVWIEPQERAIIPLYNLHVSHSLAKTLRKQVFEVRCNTAFAEVVDACAAPRPDPDGTEGESWISHRIAASYRMLHQMGYAHSIECWQDGQLVGGLYGVGFDRVFCGESMFSRRTDASKVALCWLVAAMKEARMELLDCQFMTPHLQSMGAVAMPQSQYLDLLRRSLRQPGGDSIGWRTLPEGYDSLLAAGGSSPGKFIAQSLTQTS